LIAARSMAGEKVESTADMIVLLMLFVNGTSADLRRD
jgi:hypothetical protein